MQNHSLDIIPHIQFGHVSSVNFDFECHHMLPLQNCGPYPWKSLVTLNKLLIQVLWFKIVFRNISNLYAKDFILTFNLNMSFLSVLTSSATICYHFIPIFRIVVLFHERPYQADRLSLVILNKLLIQDCFLKHLYANISSPYSNWTGHFCQFWLQVPPYATTYFKTIFSIAVLFHETQYW